MLVVIIEIKKSVCDPGKPMCTTSFIYHVLLNIRTEYRNCSERRLMGRSKKSCRRRALLQIACHHIYIQPALPHAPTTTTTTTTTQCKLLHVQVVLGKRPLAEVAEGNHHNCRVSVCASCWNEKHYQHKLLKVRGTGHQHPSAQVGAGAATTCNLHTSTYMHCGCAHVQVMLLLHPLQLAPMDAGMPLNYGGFVGFQIRQNF